MDATKKRSLILTNQNNCDYCQDNDGPIGPKIILTDAEIDRQTSRSLIKAIFGVRPTLIGADVTDWSEGKPGLPCPHCDNGAKVDAHRYAICLACTRASKLLDQAIRQVMDEQAKLLAFFHSLRTVALKQRAINQRLRRKGLLDKPGQGRHGARPAGYRGLE